MANVIDHMSPDSSPSVKNKMGVRRVNNLPLMMALGALTLFVVIIALVAVKRANQNNEVRETTSLVHRVDSSTMAEEVLAGHASGIIPSSKPVQPSTQLAMPIAVLDNPDAPPLPQRLDEQDELMRSEISRIRLEKIQQFEKAVMAKTRIELPSQISSRVSDTHDKRQEALDRINDVQRRLAQVGDPTTSYQQRLQQTRLAMKGHDLTDKGMSLLAPVSESGDRWSLGNSVEAPRTPYELRAGAVIPGTMISGVTSDLPGQIIGQVSQNVYDTATGKYLLIPQGTRLLGVYSSDVAYGQDSILVAWQRLIFPDGKALDIGSMPGSDSAGNAGFRDEVDNHYGRIFGQALLMSGIVAGVTYSQLQNQSQSVPFGPPNAGSVMSAAMGQQLGEVTAQMIAKNLNIAPQNKIRPGYLFNVTVVKDLTFTKAYQSFDY
jgi:type IV secretory pathway VirB10-like protein